MANVNNDVGDFSVRLNAGGGGGTATVRIFAEPVTGGGSPVLVYEGTQSYTNGTNTYNINGVNLASLPDQNYRFYVQTESAGDIDTSGLSDQRYVCFLQGTLIRTPEGERAVEALRIGDLVTTADGRAVPVLFIGTQTIHARFASPEASRPIRVAAGALDAGVPSRDLWVSPHHAIVFDEAFCFAQALENGRTIRPLPAPTEVFTYYSLELPAHEAILAEGAPVESFCDSVGREHFDNHAEFAALYPEGRVVGEMDLPHAKSARQVPAAIRARLAARAELLATEAGVTRAA
ncbi:Hint domain-containing protein [Roseomonas sp. CECT 9278]|uniref:Hint domain-containing protein n=1 Tax=Roseomonas sp. CECT 9278 TaxID=2845823 RepID=UPI001E652A5D|nr:Hint domain-containing protein [Roseomonas sp. CECT 9278]CAH0207331.1 hypothetical protein ROS9278_02079 [Roseomonas sp. CECT 9278]